MNIENTATEHSNHPRSLPPMACDSHLHIFERGFGKADSDPGFLTGASLADYQKVQARMGTSRAVIVTPRVFGVDNSVTVDAISKLGLSNARGIAVLRPDVGDAELDRLHAGGIRGVRFTLYSLANAPLGFAMVEPLANKIHAWGWHVQLHWSAEQIVEHAALLARLPCPIVFDHLGRLPVPFGASHQAFAVIRKLAESGKVWGKLSAPYLNSIAGVAERYRDAEAPTRAWINEFPDRIVWGSDWPHLTELEKPVAEQPDTVELLNLLHSWTEDTRISDRILVENPAELYGFAAS